MKVSSQNSSHIQKRQSFGNAYVALTKINLSDTISKNIDLFNKGDFTTMYSSSVKTAQKVIDKVNSTLKNTNGKITTAKDLVDKVDMYILAGGAGSRFKKLASSVAALRAKGEQFNKISVPFELGNNQPPLTMLEIPMAMERFFAGKDGYKKLVAEKQTGSFGDIILRYLKSGKEPKDVVVCCGDNVFDEKSEKMLDYIVRTINNPQKQLGVVGVARTPEEVANRFGVLEVGTQDKISGTFPLKSFVEKPDLDTAQKSTTPKGINIANTGMFVIKKETMAKLLEEIKKTPNLIAKNDKEIYDFANATKWARDLNGASASDVLMVKTWEDVGEPKAYHNWLKQMKEGHFLGNFTPLRRQTILDALKKRVDNDTIQFFNNPKGTTIVDGINIMA